MGVGVVDNVQPVSRPPFSVARRREQVLDFSLIGIGPIVSQECLDALRGGWKSHEIKVHTPQ
jgi:hypothetical protein